MRWLKKLFMGMSTRPWVEYDIVDGKMVNLAWNHKFVANVREALVEELARQGTYKTDEEVVALWAARRNHENEHPDLKVMHSGINPDGTLGLRLEWNDAFIKMLRNNGFDSEDEETMVQAYLASIARDNAAADLPVQQQEALSNDEPAYMENVITAATDVNALLDDLPDNIVKDLESELRRRAARRGGRRVVKK